MQPWARAALGVGAVTVAGGGFLVWRAYNNLATGDDSLDDLAVRARVLILSEVYGVDARAVMSIVNNEYNRAHSLDDQLGDTGASGGPSVGPMQVYRATAKDLGLWSPPPGASLQEERDAYAAERTDVTKMIRWGVFVFKSKLKDADGDISDAIRRYNGSGSAAENYRDRAVAFIDSTFGTDLA